MLTRAGVPALEGALIGGAAGRSGIADSNAESALWVDAGSATPDGREVGRELTPKALGREPLFWDSKSPAPLSVPPPHMEADPGPIEHDAILEKPAVLRAALMSGLDSIVSSGFEPSSRPEGEGVLLWSRVAAGPARPSSNMTRRASVDSTTVSRPHTSCESTMVPLCRWFAASDPLLLSPLPSDRVGDLGLITESTSEFLDLFDAEGVKTEVSVCCMDGNISMLPLKSSFNPPLSVFSSSRVGEPREGPKRPDKLRCSASLHSESDCLFLDILASSILHCLYWRSPSSSPHPRGGGCNKVQ
eukprot:Hpha_TRINITY_DN13589_c0_g1::TRINITY_DN13589_c0_g1_i2::g.111429::m.111429